MLKHLDNQIRMFYPQSMQREEFDILQHISLFYHLQITLDIESIQKHKFLNEDQHKCYYHMLINNYEMNFYRNIHQDIINHMFSLQDLNKLDLDKVKHIIWKQNWHIWLHNLKHTTSDHNQHNKVKDNKINMIELFREIKEQNKPIHRIQLSFEQNKEKDKIEHINVLKD